MQASLHSGQLGGQLCLLSLQARHGVAIRALPLRGAPGAPGRRRQLACSSAERGHEAQMAGRDMRGTRGAGWVLAAAAAT